MDTFAVLFADGIVLPRAVWRRAMIVVASVAILLARTQRRWVTSAVLGAGLQKATGDVPTTMRNMTTVRRLVAKLGA